MNPVIIYQMLWSLSNSVAVLLFQVQLGGQAECSLLENATKWWRRWVFLGDNSGCHTVKQNVGTHSLLVNWVRWPAFLFLRPTLTSNRRLNLFSAVVKIEKWKLASGCLLDAFFRLKAYTVALKMIDRHQCCLRDLFRLDISSLFHDLNKKRRQSIVSWLNWMMSWWGRYGKQVYFEQVSFHPSLWLTYHFKYHSRITVKLRWDKDSLIGKRDHNNDFVLKFK